MYFIRARARDYIITL